MKDTTKILLSGGTLSAGADVMMNTEILPVPESLELIIKAVIAVTTLIAFIIKNRKSKNS